MSLLVHTVMPGTPAENLKKVFALAKVLYVDLGVKKANRYKGLKLSMFSTSTGAGKQLRGSAAEIRNFGGVLLHVWRHYYNDRLHLHRTLEACLRSSWEMEAILDEHPHEFALPSDSGFSFLDTSSLYSHTHVFSISPYARLFI